MSVTLTTQSPPTPGPDANLGYLFRLAYQRFAAALDDALGDLGLSAHEYGIMSVFETRPELSTSELARLAQVTRQTMHSSILRLERGGVLERRARNQRVVLIGLTARGDRKLKAATERVRAVESAAVSGLSASQLNTVRGWLAAVAATEASGHR